MLFLSGFFILIRKPREKARAEGLAEGFVPQFFDGLKAAEQIPGTVHDGTGHAGKAGHFHAVAFVRGAGKESVQEKNAFIVLLDGDVHGEDAGHLSLELGELVLELASAVSAVDFVELEGLFHDGFLSCAGGIDAGRVVALPDCYWQIWLMP